MISFDVHLALHLFFQHLLWRYRYFQDSSDRLCALQNPTYWLHGKKRKKQRKLWDWDIVSWSLTWCLCLVLWFFRFYWITEFDICHFYKFHITAILRWGFRILAHILWVMRPNKFFTSIPSSGTILYLPQIPLGGKLLLQAYPASLQMSDFKMILVVFNENQINSI